MNYLIKTAGLAATLFMTSQAIAGEKLDDRFKEADTDKNGIISYDEMMAKVKVKFDEFDKNKDGFLTLAELPQEMPMPEHMGKRRERMKEKMEKHAEERGHDFDPEEFEGRGKPTRLQFVARADRDGDERVSLEEFSAPAVRHFKHSDLNGDGSVTKAEAKEAMKKRFVKKGKGHHGGREGFGSERR